MAVEHWPLYDRLRCLTWSKLAYTLFPLSSPNNRQSLTTIPFIQCSFTASSIYAFVIVLNMQHLSAIITYCAFNLIQSDKIDIMVSISEGSWDTEVMTCSIDARKRMPTYSKKKRKKKDCIFLIELSSVLCPLQCQFLYVSMRWEEWKEIINKYTNRFGVKWTQIGVNIKSKTTLKSET